MKYFILSMTLAAGLFGAVPSTMAQSGRVVERTVVRDVDRGPRDDDNAWRYRRHNGRWWYWTPDRRWVYWNNGRWVPYGGRAYVDRGFYGPSYRDGYRYGNRYRGRDDFYFNRRYRGGYRDYYRPGIYIGRGRAGIRF